MALKVSWLVLEKEEEEEKNGRIGEGRRGWEEGCD